MQYNLSEKTDELHPVINHSYSASKNRSKSETRHGAKIDTLSESQDSYEIFISSSSTNCKVEFISNLPMSLKQDIEELDES